MAKTRRRSHDALSIRPARLGNVRLGDQPRYRGNHVSEREMMTMDDVIQMVAGAQNGESPKSNPVDDEAAVMRLREAAGRYARMYRGERPKVGDLITPASDSCSKGAGRPHVVVEVLDVPLPRDLKEPFGSNQYGIAPDIRVACLDGDRIGAYWVESADYVAWEPESK